MSSACGGMSVTCICACISCGDSFASAKNLLHFTQATMSLSHGFLNKEFIFTYHLSPVFCMASSVLDSHLVVIVILVDASANIFALK